MMTNLFSLFDPSLSLFSFSWSILLLVILLLPSFFWSGGFLFSFVGSFFSFSKGELEYVVKAPKRGSFLFLGSVFFLVLLLNLVALFPFIFSATSHLLITLPLSYGFWFCIIFFTWVKSLNSFMAHLVPSGTPLGLMSFMVLVELLSNLIRPLALTFRLSANMMAGHLLMSLVGGFLISLPFSFMLVGSLLQSLLVLMELGVSFIQSYVFSTLLLLYLSEGEN